MEDIKLCRDCKKRYNDCQIADKEMSCFEKGDPYTCSTCEHFEVGFGEMTCGFTGDEITDENGYCRFHLEVSY